MCLALLDLEAFCVNMQVKELFQLYKGIPVYASFIKVSMHYTHTLVDVCQDVYLLNGRGWGALLWKTSF